MKSLYIAKTLHNKNLVPIVTNGTHYSPIEGAPSLDDLLTKSFAELWSLATSMKLEFTLNHWGNDFLEGQSVWGTGVTFDWSKEKLDSTPEENPYRKVYLSERSMFFLKGFKNNHAKHDDSIGIRSDCKRNIPEAELIAVHNSRKEVIGFTLGNDQTALEFESENPLFQFQAKHFFKSHSFLPLIRLGQTIETTDISLSVTRDNEKIVHTTYNTSHFKKSLTHISNRLFSCNTHPQGVFLFLGFNGDLPKDFALKEGDLIEISSDLFPIALKQKCSLIY